MDRQNALAIAELLARIKAQQEAASRRRNPNALAPQDARRPIPWDTDVRPQGNLKDGLTGFDLTFTKRF